MTVLLLVGFRTSSGEMLEETLVPVMVSFAGRRRWRRGAGLRTQVASALEQLAPRLDGIAATFAHSRAAAIGAVHRDNSAARAARERAMETLASAARTLVQPGLFGRSAMRRERAGAAADLLEDRPVAGESEQHVVWDSRVAGVVCGELP